MIDVFAALSAIASTVVILVSMAARPHAARCPIGWWLPEGVRADGVFVCRPNAPLRDGVSPRGGYLDLSAEPSGSLRGHIYCPDPTRPTTTDGTTVGCRGD